MRITHIDFSKAIAVIILIIGWATGNLNGWIVFAILFAMSELKWNFR